MKRIWPLAILLFSSLVQANTNLCEEQFGGYPLTPFDSLTAPQEVVEKAVADINSLSEAEWAQLPIIKDFDQKYCLGAFSTQELKSYGGKVLVQIVSEQDDCDGGNSYGIVIDKVNLKVIAAIQDSDYYCEL
ncbi:MAG: hypothetical protein AB8E15_00415 [Bdellovibrionales bacterium]